MVAHRLDALADGPDAVHAKSEVFADFDGLALTDALVVDHQVELAVGGLVEFDDGAGTEADNVAEAHGRSGQPDAGRR